MKNDKSAFFPLGLVFGLALGTLLGNPAPGTLFGMTIGLIISLTGQPRTG